MKSVSQSQKEGTKRQSVLPLSVLKHPPSQTCFLKNPLRETMEDLRINGGFIANHHGPHCSNFFGNNVQ